MYDDDIIAESQHQLCSLYIISHNLSSDAMNNDLEAVGLSVLLIKF